MLRRTERAWEDARRAQEYTPMSKFDGKRKLEAEVDGQLSHKRSSMVYSTVDIVAAQSDHVVQTGKGLVAQIPLCATPRRGARSL